MYFRKISLFALRKDAKLPNQISTSSPRKMYCCKFIKFREVIILIVIYLTNLYLVILEKNQ